MLSSRRRLPALGALVVALALFGAACGGDDDGGESASSSDSSSCAQDPVTTDSGLIIEDLECGEGATASRGDSVRVHYVGTLAEDGTKFDSSRDRGQPFPFKLGAGDVIPGWDQGVGGMQVGGVRKLTIPPDLAYGDTGVPGAIPPNATLVFEIELLEVENADQ